MSSGISKPSEVSAPVRSAGGDNEVPRDSKGRPRIWLDCQTCTDEESDRYVEEVGKVASEKTGKPVKCTKCAGAGRVQRSYSRVTTYIDVLEDKSNLEAWQMRMVLVGLDMDRGLLKGAKQLHAESEAASRQLGLLKSDADPDVRADLQAKAKASKDELNRRAQVAKQVAGAEAKANKGTHLHALSELADQGLDLPKNISFEDVIDIDAYNGIAKGFKIVHMEKLVVCDSIGTAGTPDRVSEWHGPEALVAPDGTRFEPGDGQRLITDLKTGTVEYGGLKMAMQLSIYAQSELYSHETGKREPLDRVNQKWGIIMNVPAGRGEGGLYWVDLEMGWQAVGIAGSIREMRRNGRKALLAFS